MLSGIWCAKCAVMLNNNRFIQHYLTGADRNSSPMPPPTRYPSNPNKVTLNLDFPTMDALKALAAQRKETSDRTAFAILQHVLGVWRDQHGQQPGAAPGEYSAPYNLSNFAAFKPNN